MFFYLEFTFFVAHHGADSCPAHFPCSFLKRMLQILITFDLKKKRILCIAALERGFSDCCKRSMLYVGVERAAGLGLLCFLSHMWVNSCYFHLTQ